MKHILTLGLAALVLVACNKNKERSVEVRTECERCMLTAGGQSLEVWGSGSLYVKATEGEAVSASSCRHAPDTTINGLDTTIRTYSAAVALWLYDGGVLALASDGAFYPDPCAEESAILPQE